MAKKQTSLRIDSVLFEKITVQAKKENRSVNNMIERAAEVYLQDMGYKKPDVVGQSEQLSCEHRWKEYEGTSCRMGWKCSKCKEVKYL